VDGAGVLDRILKHGPFGTSAIRNTGPAVKEIIEFKTLEDDSDSETKVFYLPVSTVRRQPGRPRKERTELKSEEDGYCPADSEVPVSVLCNRTFGEDMQGIMKNNTFGLMIY